MVPKVIHYCWFGGNKLPNEAIKCIDSWRKFLPDYEIKEWNEDNFDVNMIPYTSQAYQAKKYAFVSDYARFWVLYQYGGVYFDTDVEVIRNMDEILCKGPFMGCEVDAMTQRGIAVAPGLGLAIRSKHEFYKKMISLYANLEFYNNDGSFNTKTIVSYTTEILMEYGLKNIVGIQEVEGIKVYPREYFNPLDFKTGKILVTLNTYTIHHYMASWHSPYQKAVSKIHRLFGDSFIKMIVRIKHILK